MSGERPTGAGRVPVDDIESLLGKLAGVISARVIVNDWGAIEELHVLASSERNPKQVVRDIESTLAAQWGIQIDHKKVSVAQLTGHNPGRTPDLLRLDGVEMTSDVSRGVAEVAVTVRSTDGDATSRGVVCGVYRSQGLRLAAEAAAEAVNNLLDRGTMLSVDEVCMNSTPASDVVTVLCTLVLQGAEQLVASAEVVKDDPLEAVASAVVDCVRRECPRELLRRMPKQSPDTG